MFTAPHIPYKTLAALPGQLKIASHTVWWARPRLVVAGRLAPCVLSLRVVMGPMHARAEEHGAGAYASVHGVWI